MHTKPGSASWSPTSSAGTPANRRSNSCPVWAPSWARWSSPRSVTYIGSPIPPNYVCGPGVARAPTSPTPWCAADTSPNRVPSWCGGPPWRPSSAIPPRRRSPSTAPGSSHAAARTSPRSPWRANCSPWSTTGCATGTSAPWAPAERREQPGRHTRAAAALSDPLPGVVAHLIDPACCHRTAPCPHQLGEGMTGSRTPIRPCPNLSAHHTWRRTPTYNNLAADLPASADSMHRAGPASRPFVLATLRALRLDPGPYPVLSTRRPKTSKTTAQQPLDTPRPFRDDSAVPPAELENAYY